MTPEGKRDFEVDDFILGICLDRDVEDPMQYAQHPRCVLQVTADLIRSFVAYHDDLCTFFSMQQASRHCLCLIMIREIL
jgi:hypothetical protein